MWILVVMALLGAAGPAAAAPLQGQWGGDRTIVQITETGGRIEQDCASGTFAGPIRADARGHFIASGRFDDHEAGSQREDAAATAARFEGHVAGNTLHLAIHIGTAPPRRLTLVAGQAVKLLRCY